LHLWRLLLSWLPGGKRLRATFDEVIEAGGTPLGQTTDLGTPEAPFLFVYLRDPEGNVVELEQR
jgi:hypothetical protein